MMKKIFEASLMSALALVAFGCGGSGSGTAAQPVVTNPTGTYYQTFQYTCASNYIQLRNSFGSSQCFQTTDINQACAQSRGQMVQGTLCRHERQIQGRVNYRIRNRDGYSPTQIPLQIQLFPGESAKIFGRIDLGDDCTQSQWDAQLIQNQMVIGSASSGGVVNANGNNIEIVAMSNNTNTTAGQCPVGTYLLNGQCVSQQQQQVGGQCYASQVAACSAGYYYVNGQCCSNQAGGYNTGYNIPQMPTSQLYALDLMFQGSARIDLKAAAISCEDGHGNSYPCQ